MGRAEGKGNMKGRTQRAMRRDDGDGLGEGLEEWDTILIAVDAGAVDTV